MTEQEIAEKVILACQIYNTISSCNEVSCPGLGFHIKGSQPKMYHGDWVVISLEELTNKFKTIKSFTIMCICAAIESFDADKYDNIALIFHDMFDNFSDTSQKGTIDLYYKLKSDNNK